MVDLVIYASNAKHKKTVFKLFKALSKAKDMFRFVIVSNEEATGDNGGDRETGQDADHVNGTERCAMNGQAVRGQAMDGQAMNGQAMSGQAMNVQAMNVQAVSEQAVNGQAVRGQAMDGQAMNGQAMNVQAMNVQAVSRQAMNGQAVSGQAMKTATDGARNSNRQCADRVNGTERRAMSGQAMRTATDGARNGRQYRKGDVHVLIADSRARQAGKYDFVIYEDADINVALERTLLCIFNYGKVVIDGLHVVDQHGTHITATIAVYVRQMPYLRHPCTLRHDRHGTVRCQGVYHNNSTPCHNESAIIRQLLDEYDLSFTDGSNNVYILYRFYGTVMMTGMPVPDTLMSMVCTRHAQTIMAEFFEKGGDGMNVFFRNVFLCEYHIPGLYKHFEDRVWEVLDSGDVYAYLQRMLDVLPVFDDHRQACYGRLMAYLNRSLDE